MKTIKRIVSIVLFVVLASIVGYAVYTANRLSAGFIQENYIEKSFASTDGNIQLQFDIDLNAVYTVDEVITNLTFNSEIDGVILLNQGENPQLFIALTDNMLYDCEHKQILYRSSEYGKKD